MGKSKSLLDEAFEVYVLYKCRWVIIIGIILLLVAGFKASKELDKKYQEYGYSGFEDDIEYDEFTDEIIPKAEIETYNNDNKYITKSNGEKVYFSQIKEQKNAYERVQGSYAFISEQSIEEVRSICDILLVNYFEKNYTIEKVPETIFYIIHVRDITINGIYHEDFEIGSESEMQRFVKYLVKGIYREQNNLEPDYGNWNYKKKT